MQLYSLRGEMEGYLCTLVNRRERGLDIWLSSNRLERGEKSWGPGEGWLVVTRDRFSSVVEKVSWF